MRKFITEKLIEWKNSKDRKPLLLKGRDRLVRVIY